MDQDRRDLIKAVTGASAMIVGLGGAADSGAAEAGAAVAPLAAAGLDFATVYRKIWASTDMAQGTCWWFCGPITVDVDEVGPAFFVQEETLRILRTENIGRDAFYIHFREAGILRDMQTGNVTTSIYDPVKGERSPRNGNLHTDPARFTVNGSQGGLTVSLVYPGAAVLSVTVAAAIDGDRVSLTHREYKLRPTRKTPQCSTLKFYASLADLKSSAPSVAAQGFYSIRGMDTGNVVISGVMQKAAVDEKLNPLAWDRIRSLHPEFFDGDKVALNWT